MDREINNPIRDKALKRAFAAMENGRIKCLSLDIFDTLLWRHYAKPVDLFYYLGDRLIADALVPAHLSAEEIARARIDSENTARRLGLAERDSVEITLDEIWQASVLPLTGDHRWQQARDLELAVEEQSLHADPAVLALVKMAGNMGIPVILVSDTYFTAAMLTRFISNSCPNIGAIAKIFASCEYRVSKATGLFDIVLQETGFQPQDILHIGDSFDADIAPPAALGIDCQHYSNHIDTIIHCRRRELQDAFGNDHPGLMQGRYGDYGLNRLRTRLVRMDTTRPRSKQGAMLWDRGMAVMGPALSGYIQWAAHRIDNIKPSRVLCLMREGEFLQSLLQDIRPDLAGISETFWASRQVLKKVAIFNASREELEEYIDRPYPTTIRALLTDFDVDADVIAPLPSELLDMHLDSDGTKNHFFDFLATRPDITFAIRESTARQRKAYLEWLTPILGAGKESKTIILLDLGYAGSIQHGLAKLIATLPGMEAVTLHGLYMFTGSKAANNCRPNNVMEGFATTMGAPNATAHPVMRSPELLEQVCMPRTGSLIGIDTDGNPVLAQNAIPEEQHQQMDTMRAGVRAFHRNWTKLPPIQDTGDATYWQGFSQTACRPLVAFIQQPGIHEAVLFGAFRHDENLGSNRTRLLADPNRFVLRKDHISGSWLAKSHSSELFWPQAAAAMGGASVVQAMRQAKNTSAESSINAEKQRTNIEVTLLGPDGQSLRLMKAAWRCQSENYRTSLRFPWQDWPVTAIAFGPLMSGTLCRIDAVDFFLPAEDFEDSFMPQRIDQGTTDEGMVISENAFICLSPQSSWRTDVSLPTQVLQQGQTIELDICFGIVRMAPVYKNAGITENQPENG